mgnify:CR=1 FL=1|tara:strand:- start:658 stop:942 length:285 start_codon:yes stop_codon:yes gene_type:complete
MEKSYLRLYSAIITRAILDNTFRTSPNYNKSDIIICEEAKNWFFGDDFNYICSIIDIKPSVVRKINEQFKKTKKKFAQNEAQKIIFEVIRRNIE